MTGAEAGVGLEAEAEIKSEIQMEEETGGGDNEWD